MSRKVDKRELRSLGKKDLEYLRDRGRLSPEEEVRYLGGSKASAPQAPPIDEVPNTGDVGANPPDGGKAAPTGAEAGDGEEVEPITENYDDYKVDELIGEVKRRNADREDDEKVRPESTKKQDIIDALEEDDEENGE